MNKVLITGRLVSDPEVKSGTSKVGNEYTILTFTLAVNAGKDTSYFFDCKAFNEDAKNIEKLNLKKGSSIEVEGKLTQDKWTNQEGKVNSKVIINVSHVSYGSFSKKESSIKEEKVEVTLDEDDNDRI